MLNYTEECDCGADSATAPVCAAKSKINKADARTHLSAAAKTTHQPKKRTVRSLIVDFERPTSKLQPRHKINMLLLLLKDLGLILLQRFI